MTRIAAAFFVLVCCVSSSPAQMVVISEIMYHPLPDQPEYLVLSNQTRTPLDLAGAKVTAAVALTLPDFDPGHPEVSFLKPFQSVVLSAADPEETRAAYGFPPAVQVFGPWVGALADQGESVRVEDSSGKVLCESGYGPGWSAAARGTGCALVLVDSCDSATDPGNWRAEFRPSPFPAPPPANLGTRINEVVRSQAGVVEVELFNAGPREESMAALSLVIGADLSRAQRLSESLPAGHCRSWRFDAEAIGDVLVVLMEASGAVIDSVSVPAKTVSYQAFPDGGNEWYRTEPGSLGQRNQPFRETNVVINEIMYDLPSGHPGVEYIELYNQGSSVVDLSRWRLTGAIRFEFPEGIQLAPDAFLVVSQDAAQLARLYGEIAVLGDFKGHLSSQGEEIRVADQAGNLVDKVRYAGGGAWPERARGRGSSLELVHPRMDNSLPSAWAASRELSESTFVTCVVTGVYEQLRVVGEPSDYKELQLHLADDGAAILRGFELRRAGTNCLANSDRMGTGADGWFAQGTHWASGITNGELHVVSDGHGDNRSNQLELDVPALEPGEQYVLSLQARWLSGSPRLIVQTFDQSLAGSFALPIPDRLGTPGLPNSCLASGPVPQVDELLHRPAVPEPGQPVHVSARVRATRGLREVGVHFRVSGQSAEWSVAPAFDDGKNGGDEVAGDEIFTAQIDGVSRVGAVVQFYFEAMDKQGGRARRADPSAPAMWVVDDRDLPEDLRLVRVVVWPGDLEEMGEGRFPRLSNHYWNATVIEGDRAVYGASTRARGSPLTRTPDLERLNVKWPADRLHRGQRKWIYDDDAAKGIAYHNRVARYLLSLSGQPVSDSEFVRVVVNTGPAGLREETEPIGKEFLDRRFEDGRKGELYKADDQWWSVDTGEGEMEDASWEYRGEKVARYRNAWMKRTREDQDDYSRLLKLFQVLSNSPQAEVETYLNAQSVLRLAAVRGFIGDWDNFTMQRGRNGYFYCPPGDGRFMWLHWDSDEGFMTGPDLYGGFIEGWLKRPENWSRFHREVQEVMTHTVDRPERLRAWLALEREATDGVIFLADYLNFFRARSRELREGTGFMTSGNSDSGG